MSSQRLAGAVLFFVLLAVAAFHSLTHRWDLVVTVWLQHAAPFADVPAAILVVLGNAEVMIFGAVLATLLLFLRDRNRGLAMLWLAAWLIGASILAVGLKHVIVHPGPPLSLQRHVLRFGISLPTPFSFPSGHTMRTTIVAGTVLRRSPLLAGVIVLVMMAALIYLGDHWLSDVLGGLCVGWACVEVARARTP